MENAIFTNKFKTQGDGKPTFRGEITANGVTYKIALFEKPSKYDGEGPWYSVKLTPATEDVPTPKHETASAAPKAVNSGGKVPGHGYEGNRTKSPAELAHEAKLRAYVDPNE